MPKTEGHGLPLAGLRAVWSVYGSHEVAFKGFC